MMDKTSGTLEWIRSERQNVLVDFKFFISIHSQFREGNIFHLKVLDEEVNF